MNIPTYSIVIPVFNEEKTLPELRSRLESMLHDLDGDTEVILVDDGSSDGSYGLMQKLHQQDGRFKVVHLARNFGHQLAITAGIDLAAGEAVVIMDADLQDPPEVVLELAKKWREGYEIVYGVRQDRSSDTWFKRQTAAAYYRILGRLTEVDIPADVGDFRLVDRRAVEAFKGMREQSRYVRGMFSWIGFRQIGVPYRRAERYAGQTKYPFRKMSRLAVDGIVGFSRVPLRLALNLGFLCSFLAFGAGVYTLTGRLFGAYAVPGWTSVVMAVLFLGGIQLAVMGFMGEYIGRIYEEAIHRPLYIVAGLHGVATGIGAAPRAVIAEPRTVSSLLGEQALLDLRVTR
jgi:glycosyltransferase involved in cell wall biosynthesis